MTHSDYGRGDGSERSVQVPAEILRGQEDYRTSDYNTVDVRREAYCQGERGCGGHIHRLEGRPSSCES